MSWHSALPLALALALAALAVQPPDGGARADDAGWPLVAAESSLYFVGIKNNAAAVTGSFARLSGALDPEARSGWLEIEAASLESGDPERDRNIILHIFASETSPSVRFSVSRVSGAEALPAPGGSVALEVAGVLSIRGHDVELSVPVRLYREGPARVRVQTRRPFAVTQEQLGLEQAFAILKAVCAHESLAGVVPIQLDLVFER